MGEKLMAATSVKILVGGQPVAMAPTAQLTISEENDSTKDGDGYYFVGGLHKSWDISCEGLVNEVSPDVDMLLKDVSMDDLAVTIYSTLGKMPRKMKKAHKTDPLRRTKWGRKLQNYDAYGRDKVTIDMTRYATGVYFVRVHSPKAVVIQKVIRER